MFWTEGETDHGGEPSRGVLVSDGNGAWTIVFELGIDADEELQADEDGMIWEPGGSFLPASIAFGRGFLGDLTRMVMDCDRNHSSLIEMMAKGKSELPTRKPVTLVRLTGSKRFTVKLVSVGGTSDGHPMMHFEQSRPLIAEELFVVCRRLAVAVDWWKNRMGDLA